MSFLAASGLIGFLGVAVGALAGVSLRFVVHLGLGSADGSKKAWLVESIAALVVGLLAGVLLIPSSGQGLSVFGLAAAAGLAAYAGTAFAVVWMGQEARDRAPVVPVGHLVVALVASLAGAAVVLAFAGLL